MALFGVLNYSNQSNMPISFVLETLFGYSTNRKTVKTWFALTIRDGVHMFL